MCLNPNPEVKPRQGRWEYLGVSILLHLHVTDLAIALPDIGIIITIINARSLDVSSDQLTSVIMAVLRSGEESPQEVDTSLSASSSTSHA
jgi:hypothetical protein